MKRRMGRRDKSLVHLLKERATKVLVFVILIITNFRGVFKI